MYRPGGLFGFQGWGLDLEGGVLAGGGGRESGGTLDYSKSWMRGFKQLQWPRATLLRHMQGPPQTDRFLRCVCV